MALKFLNKKGWHTGSLRNIENVWKAEQKHNAEEKKLDELRKQIQEERERSDFRRLQEQAGLVPRQERLDFLYESGLAVGKISEGFRDLAAPVPVPAAAAAADVPAPQAAVPGALFEDKPQSANDAWRKLHTDPLLLIRQREKEALDRIKNNPMKMAMIRKSVEADKKDKHGKKDKLEKKDGKRKHKSKHSSEVMSDSEKRNQHKSKKKKHSSGSKSDSEDFSEGDRESKKRDPSNHSKRTHPYPKHAGGEENKRLGYQIRSDLKHKGGGDEDRREGKHSSEYRTDSKHTGGGDEDRREGKRTNSEYHSDSKHTGAGYKDRREGKRTNSEHHSDSKHTGGGDEDRREGRRTNSEYHSDSKHTGGGDKDRREGKRTNSDHHGEERRKSYLPVSDIPVEKNLSATQTHDIGRSYGYNRRQNVPKLSEEERASRLREMQIDAELHEEQRWKRLKKAADADAREANTAQPSGGKNFLDAAERSIYGTEKGGSSTIEESVRRRAYYSQGGSADHESNAFRR